MTNPETDDELPPEAQQRTFDQAMELWVLPEVERRRQLGLIEGTLALTAAQVIMREGQPLEVRLNEEIIAVARMKVAHGVAAGDPVDLANVEAVSEIRLTDADPDAAHLTLINLGGDWSLAFDFRHNATKARRMTEIAEEFLATAIEARDAGRVRAAIDNLYSAVELMAVVELLLLPVEGGPKDGRFKHQFVQMVVNKCGKGGLLADSAESAAALNRLTSLRHAARYQPDPLEASDLADLIELAVGRHQRIAAALPERVAVNPDLPASKPRAPARLASSKGE